MNTNNGYYFKCDKEYGGKCCFGVTYIEKENIMFFSDKVPMFFEIRYFANSYLKSLAKKHKKFTDLIKQSSVKIAKENDNRIVYLLSDLMIGSMKQNDKCYFLSDDGLCNLHNDKKPLKCKLLPLNPLIPLEKMNFAFNQMKPICIGFNNKTNLLWKNQKIYNKEMKQLYFEYFKKFKGLKSALEINIPIMEEVSFDEIEKMFLNSHGTFLFPIFPIDDIFKNLGIVKYKDEFINNQIKTINNYFKLYPKTKEDKFLEKQLSIYQEFEKR